MIRSRFCGITLNFLKPRQPNPIELGWCGDPAELHRIDSIVNLDIAFGTICHIARPGFALAIRAAYKKFTAIRHAIEVDGVRLPGVDLNLHRGASLANSQSVTGASARSPKSQTPGIEPQGQAVA